jgi:formate dehydrogenase iron-sulfur subunit
VNTPESYHLYGRNRLAEGKLPLCSEMCSTKALLAGDGEIIATIYKERVLRRGYGSNAWGWSTAYRDSPSPLSGGNSQWPAQDRTESGRQA